MLRQIFLFIDSLPACYLRWLMVTHSLSAEPDNALYAHLRLERQHATIEVCAPRRRSWAPLCFRGGNLLSESAGEVGRFYRSNSDSSLQPGRSHLRSGRSWPQLAPFARLNHAV